MDKRSTRSAFYEKEADANNYLYLRKLTSDKYVGRLPHYHDSVELVLTIKGQCVVFINGNKYILNEGELAFIDRFDVHYYEYIQDSEYYVMLINKKLLNDFNGFDKQKLPVFLQKCDKFDEFKQLFDSVYNLWHEANYVFRSGFVNIVLGMLSDQYTLVERELKGDVKALVHALMYLDENYSQNITLEFLSNKFGYSKNYFSSLFNKFTGMSLREYLNRRRIYEFENLKKQNPSEPTYLIAQKCGFESIKTFYRAYNCYCQTK